MLTNATPIGSFPVNAAIGPYLRVKMSSGYLAVAGAHDRELGTTKQRILVTGVGAVDYGAVVLANAAGIRKCIANGAITQYALVYRAASGKVSGTVTLGKPYGILVSATTTTDGDECEVLTVPDAVADMVYRAVAASAAHTNTTDAANFDKSYTFPANSLAAGDIIRIVAQAVATSTDSTDTLALLLTLGGVTLATTGAVDVANGDIGHFTCDIVIRTAGGSGTYVACGTQCLGVPGTVTAKPFFKASTSIDTTATQVVAVNADWSVAAAANSCRLDVLNVQHIKV
jgi:hypothetical protein